jgi:hypothetical protein
MIPVTGNCKAGSLSIRYKTFRLYGDIKLAVIEYDTGFAAYRGPYWPAALIYIGYNYACKKLNSSKPIFKTLQKPFI